MNTDLEDQLKPLPVQRPVQDRAEGAFTLVELQVVLATLAILSVLLLPALAGTQSGNSKTFQCLNNMRQMAVAWSLYAADNHDRVVYNFTASSIQADLAANPPNYRSWVCDTMSWSLDWQITNLDGILKAPFNQYVGGSATFYKCPADNYVSPIQRAAGWIARPRSYSMNCYLGAANPNWTSDGNQFFPSYRQFLKTGTIPNPANLFVTLDEHPDSINDGYFENSADPNGANWSGQAWADSPAAFHGGAAGFSFADGHSEIHKWKSRVCTVLPVTFGPSAHRPFDANGLVDANWIATRSSVLR